MGVSGVVNEAKVPLSLLVSSRERTICNGRARVVEAPKPNHGPNT